MRNKVVILCNINQQKSLNIVACNASIMRFLLSQVRNVSSVVTRRREQRVLVMVVTMVACYLVCWLPYGVAALIATFGPRDFLTPEASITPSLLAKCSTVINPFIYIFMNKQVRCSRSLFSLVHLSSVC